jgi:predicted phage tail protein
VPHVVPELFGVSVQLLVPLHAEVMQAVDVQVTVVPVQLPAGESQILVKAYNRVEQWGWFMRFTEVGGKPLGNLAFSPQVEEGR